MTQITEIKAADLISFIESDEYKKFSPKPITELRAISQYHNPDVLTDDTVLIIAHKNSDVIGFIGLLPRNTNESNLHVYSNTCWWVHPEKGKSLGLTLLFSALKKFDSRMYFAESAQHTTSILEKTGYFEFPKPTSGIRGFLRFYVADIFAKKYKNLKIIKWILMVVDSVLNILWQPVRYYFLNKYFKNKLEYEPVEKIDQELTEFICAHSKNEFIHKSPAIFEWIKKYPWVKESLDREPYEYPFTYYVRKYSLDYFVLRKDGNIKAFVAISNRDNLAKIPFLYFEKDVTTEVIHSIFWFISKKNYDSVVSFHPTVVDFMKQNRLPFYFKKNEKKVHGATKALFKEFSKKPVLQDGDGDVVFT